MPSIPDADNKAETADASRLDATRRVLENRSSRWKYTATARGF
jgi:hypothetical protein